MQLGVRAYSGMLDCLRKVRAVEGTRALYAGFTTTLTMNIPYHAIYFASYESYKLALTPMWGASSDEHSIGMHLLAGGAAGATAGALTTPLDVTKTRLQTQGDTGKRYGGMVDGVRT